MPISRKDRDILRTLGTRIAEVAALPVQQETIACWRANNGLRPRRPMVTIDQIPWHEMDVDGELTLETEDGLCRDAETRLRRTLYAWKHMRVDMVVEPAIDFDKIIRGGGFGIDVVENRAVLDPNNTVVGHCYIDQIPDEEALEKIRFSEIALDEAATEEIREKAEDLFCGILEVRMQGWFPALAAWDTIAVWHGVENILRDVIERPEFIHKLIGRLTEAHLDQLDQLERKGLLGRDQPLIHCTGAFSDELPAAGFDPQHVRAKDLWTYGMAQIFAAVSPAMQKEFELDYAVRWFERFGLVYYGCCEPLDNKISIIRAMPNVRKISMSPWVDIEKGAERIGGDYVFSRKPNPAFLAGSTWDPEIVRNDLQQTIEACARHNCPLELILKDISTVSYQPQRLWEWAALSAELVRG